jgi:hypothetical protein
MAATEARHRAPGRVGILITASLAATSVLLAACGGGTTPAASSKHQTTSTTTTTTAGSSAPVPVLGQAVGAFSQGQGFGEVKPTTVFNGGDPTGDVSDITWSSWGGARAVGSGMSDYVGLGQSVASGTEEPVTVVAFDLGTCGGRFMYQAVEWYFPQHNQRFDANEYEDICDGTYYPPPTPG